MFTRTLRSSLISQRLPVSQLNSVSQKSLIATSRQLSYHTQPPVNSITSVEIPQSTQSKPDVAPKVVFYPRHQALGTRGPPVKTEPLKDNLDQSVQTLLPLLRSQPPFYSTIHIHGKPYLVTEGDTIRLPFLMPGVEPGDILRLNRVTAIGSRDYTLKAGTKDTRREKQKYLDESLYTIRARVMGTVQEPERLKVWHVKRRRHKKHIWSQHKFTVLTISELSVSDSVNTTKE